MSNTTASNSTSSAIKVIQDLYQALGTGDVEGVMARLDPKVVVVEPTVLPYGGTHNGRDNFLNSVLGVMMATAEVALTDSTLADDGNGTVVGILNGELTGRQTGEKFPLHMIEIHKVVGEVSKHIDIYLQNPEDLAAFYSRNPIAA